jgi:hypothetical protein
MEPLDSPVDYLIVATVTVTVTTTATWDLSRIQMQTEKVPQISV